MKKIFKEKFKEKIKTGIILIGLVVLFVFIPLNDTSSAGYKDILIYLIGIDTLEYHDNEFKNTLESAGFNVTLKLRCITGELSTGFPGGDKLTDYGQVWFLEYDGIPATFTKEERDAIFSYFNDGGRILLAGENTPRQFNDINAISQRFDVTIKGGLADGSERSHSTVISTGTINSNEILNGVNKIATTGNMSNAPVDIDVTTNPNIECIGKTITNFCFIYALDCKSRIIFHPSWATFIEPPASPNITYDESKQYIKNVANWLCGTPTLSYCPSSPTCTITPSSTSISSGETVTLTWSSENATKVARSNLGSANALEISGSKEFSPASTTIYRLTVKNDAGEEGYCEARVNVQQPLPVISGPCHDLVPCGTSKHPNDCTLNDLFVMLKNIVDCLVHLSTIVCLFFIVIGGLLYIFSLGNPEMCTKAKNTILWAVGGLALVFLAWLIINVILIKVFGVQESFLMWWGK